MADINDMGKSALAIVLTIVIITVSAIVLDEFQVTVRDLDGTATTTVINESDAYINSTAYQLEGLTSEQGPFVFAISFAINESGDEIDAANWTLDSGTGILTNSTIAPIMWNTVNFSYTIASSEQSAAFNATSEGLGGMNTFADWIDIIVIMIVVGIVIALIYGVFRYMGGTTGY